MSERREIARDGARPQKNSGRGRYQKGDAVQDDYYLIDYKEYSKGMRVDKKVWTKVCTDAVVSGNYEPAIKLILGEPGNLVRLAIISWEEFERLKEKE